MHCQHMNTRLNPLAMEGAVKAGAGGGGGDLGERGKEGYRRQGNIKQKMITEEVVRRQE